MKYFVKTRNWHCNKTVFKLLSITQKFGVYRGDSYTDGDGKFCLDTTNGFKAVLIWSYFMLLSRFSGGWTYLVRTKTIFNGFCGGDSKNMYWNYKPF